MTAVYFLGYLLPILPLAAVEDDALFRRGMLTFTIMLTVSFASFIVHPVCLTPPAVGLPGFLEDYFMSVSTNCFPSLHVGSAALVALFFWEKRVPWRIPLAILCAGIALSTLLIKVHYILDVVGGAGLAIALYALTLRPSLMRWMTSRE